VHKALLVLGLLLRGPQHGYELHRIVRAHGELYTDLKKANLYHLLGRLAEQGYLDVRAESGAQGPRGERLIYALTDQGRVHFRELLGAILRTYEPVHTGVDVAVVFLTQLPRDEALSLLVARRSVVATRRATAAAELGDVAARGLLGSLAADHLLSLIDAELAWIERALVRLRAEGWPTDPDDMDHHSARESRP